MGSVRLGVDVARRSGLPLPGRGRVALLCNATTVTEDWIPTAEAVSRIDGVRLERIFSPQHGFAAEEQDNMNESGDAIHPGLGVRIASLYGERREPAPDAFDGIDALLIDLQDVGTRVYTFLVTAILTIRSALRAGVQVIVLDRPNPIGGAIEGPTLAPGFESFVGIVDVPLRHGLTPGEFCLYGSWRLGLIPENEAMRIAAAARSRGEGPPALRIVPLEGWHRDRFHDETGLPWTMPSPNMPTVATALVYPGQVILEGTTLSEGRGTTCPFETFGAPNLNPQQILEGLSDADRTGAVLREVAFQPTFNKHAGQLVRGFQIHVQDRVSFRPVRLTTALLAAARRCGPSSFGWKPPPYEYVWDHPAIDVIAGSDRYRKAIDGGAAAAEIEATWKPDIEAYRERVKPLLLYD